MRGRFSGLLGAGCGALLAATPIQAQQADEAGPVPAVPAAAPTDAAADLAKSLSNPVSSLISVPFQFNYDGDIGPARDGDRITINIQPVVPVSVSPDWNVVSRTIVPVIWQRDIGPGTGSQFGLGDTVQSFFFTPKKSGGIIWGAGPVVLIPTGTDELLSGRKLGGGPTGVVLKQAGQWTIGALANHIWSIAGDSKRADISATFVNPFISHTSKSAFTVGLAADMTYDWKADKVIMPVTLSASQLVSIDKQMLSVGASVRYYAATTPSSPHGIAGRVVVTLLFPKK